MDKRLLSIVLGFSLTASAHAGVVINEILYNSPGDYDSLQFIELLNDSSSPADVSGWSFSKGVDYRFADKTVLPPQGFAVLTTDAELYRKVYGVKPQGVFKGRLKKKGERVELQDAKGVRVDTVLFGDKTPWPASADGFGSSLERISPLAPGEGPENWTASTLPSDGRPGGTPGRRNGGYLPQLPPWISKVAELPSSVPGGQPIPVSAQVADPDGVESVVLRYRVATVGELDAEVRVAMSKVGEDGFQAEVPAQPAGRLVRIVLEAKDSKGAVRVYPGANEPRPALSVWVEGEIQKTRLPWFQVVQTRRSDVEALQASRNGQRRFGGGGTAEPPQVRAERQLVVGYDFSYIWSQLALEQAVSSNSLVAVQALFVKRAETLQAEMQESMARVGSLDSESVRREIRARRDLFVARLLPLLASDEASSFSAWWKQQGLNTNLRTTGAAAGPRPSVIRRLWDIERGFAALCLRPGVTGVDIQRWAQWITEARRDRDALEVMARSMMEEEGGAEKVRARLEPARAKLAARLKGDGGDALAELLESNLALRVARGTLAAVDGVQGESALITRDPATGQTQVFDFVHVNARLAGYKVHLHKDRMWQDMTSLNLIFETHERFVVAEPMAFQLYRDAGNAACRTDFVRLRVNDHDLGYHLLVEQPNKAFLRHNRIRDEGNLYKLLWYGNGLAGQHEKKTHLSGGHEDLVAVVDAIKSAKGDEERWKVIQSNFDVQQVIQYFAVNLVLSHWDGFFNNYFIYHDTGGTGKWTMYPWDQDKTWGFHDGVGEDEVFIDMPVSFGMDGDRPPGIRGLAGLFMPQSFNGGMHTWWRPPGWFSGPLLSNPTFRKHYLARVKHLLENEYSPARWEPRFKELETRLGDEVAFRAELTGDDAAAARKRLGIHVGLLREHLLNRRRFLFSQSEIKSAGAWVPAGIQ